ncbi:ornithine cyclodeaminase family protein [Metabacillus litoralis]|uniref:ornithine cyclodeaminase family protein n=1 Tax=Metabacillus litoralis TaxID=152268 RepID=UPI00203B1824|nr:ornithine cyclodeaminase family protein [Metabacillus litoralis]MCM3411841.1 ornithine cyclodeaminase family protein [Metabacillus litoralis]
MLVLSEKDIKNSLTMEEAINVMEEAFLKYANNEFVMPARNFSEVKGEDTLLVMPCFVDDCIGLKVVTSYPSNSTSSSPITQGLVLINNRETGDPLAIINGTLLTAIKTGAVSGVAMRILMKDAESIGLIGTGLQGMYQLVAAVSSTSVKTIYLFNRSSEKIKKFIQEFRKVSVREINIIPVLDIMELVRHSQIIITATTSVSPVLPDESGLYNNKLIVGVGSYKSNMRELPQKLFEDSDYYYIDSEQGKVECGDIIDPLEKGWVKNNQIVLLSDFFKGELPISQNKNPIVFKNVSMALFDASIGNYVYKKARKLGIGQEISL